MSGEGTADSEAHRATPSSFGWIVTTIVALVFKTLGVWWPVWPHLALLATA